jgi:hypothetical protein
MLKETIRGRRFSISVKGLCGVFLLLFYFIGNNQVNTFHNLYHDHSNLVTHTADQEKDPCHLSVYHYDGSNGCSHKEHLSVNEKCDLCQPFIHVDELITFDSPGKRIKLNLFCKSKEIPQALADVYIHLPSRAPPLA